LSDETQAASTGHLNDFGFFPLPQILLTVMRQAVAGLVLNESASVFTFETKATTMVNVGAGKCVTLDSLILILISIFDLIVVPVVLRSTCILVACKYVAHHHCNHHYYFINH